jgi:hypothetical protein
MTGRILWQGAKPWGGELVGEGPGKVGRVGCVVTSFANLLRHWGDLTATPLTVMAKAKAHAVAKGVRAFIRDNVVWDVIGAGNGLVVHDVVDDRNGEEGMRKAIRDALDAGGAAFLWVDKDDAIPDGDPRGKHWVVAVAREDDVVVYLDSATVDEGTLSLETLNGLSVWNGATKIYQVRAVRAVTRSAPL